MVKLGPRTLFILCFLAQKVSLKRVIGNANRRCGGYIDIVTNVTPSRPSAPYRENTCLVWRFCSPSLQLDILSTIGSKHWEAMELHILCLLFAQVLLGFATLLAFVL